MYVSCGLSFMTSVQLPDGLEGSRSKDHCGSIELCRTGRCSPVHCSCKCHAIYMCARLWMHIDWMECWCMYQCAFVLLYCMLTRASSSAAAVKLLCVVVTSHAAMWSSCCFSIEALLAAYNCHGCISIDPLWLMMSSAHRTV